MERLNTDRRRRGQSLVEVALLLPLVVMLMLGLVDFGRAYYILVSLNDAADEGATYAAIHPADEMGIRVRSASASSKLVPIDENSVYVTYPPTLYAGAPITVTVEHAFELVTPFANGLAPEGGLTLRGRATHSIISVW